MSSNKKISIISLAVSAAALTGIFVPTLIGLDGFDGGYAFSTISFLICVSAIITAIVFWQMAVQENSIKRGRNLIVHWTYTEEEWQEFTRVEYKIDKSDKRRLFFLISGFALFFGVLFFLYDRENGIYVLYAMLALIVLIAFVAYLSIHLTHRKNLKNKGEVFISSDGVILNGQLHPWNMPGSKLEGVSYNQDTSPRYLEFSYSIIARYGRQINSVRVPVPKDQESKTPALIKKLSALIQSL